MLLDVPADGQALRTTGQPEDRPMTQTLLAPSDLTHADRCDRCGAQAFYRAVLTTGELMFCAHHGREYADRLATVAVRIDDGTGAINSKPSPAAY